MKPAAEKTGSTFSCLPAAAHDGGHGEGCACEKRPHAQPTHIDLRIYHDKELRLPADSKGREKPA